MATDVRTEYAFKIGAMSKDELIAELNNWGSDTNADSSYDLRSEALDAFDKVDDHWYFNGIHANEIEVEADKLKNACIDYENTLKEMGLLEDFKRISEKLRLIATSLIQGGA